MLIDCNIHRRTVSAAKLGLIVLVSVFLAACDSLRTTNSFGTTLVAVNPSSFNCPSMGPDLDLRIHQDVNGDPDRIECLNGDTCTEPLFDEDRVNVKRNQTIRWKLKSEDTSPNFYVIFNDDKSPAHANNNRGSSIVGSENGELCVKVHRRANRDIHGFVYRYSVYVKHCSGCRPKVLDPIIYVY